MPLKKKKKPASKKRPVTRRKTVKRPARRPVKKAVKKTPGKRTAAKRPRGARVIKETLKEPVVGIVTHYFPHVNAAVVKMKKELSAGDNIRIKGHTTDFTQQANSIQIDRQPITTAKKGQEIGLMVVSRVRQHDLVYKI